MNLISLQYNDKDLDIILKKLLVHGYYNPKFQPSINLQPSFILYTDLCKPIDIYFNGDMMKGPSGAQKGTVYVYIKPNEYFLSTLGVDDCRLKINFNL
uniref:Uncharacterized protein n=1 Tax=Pithovirus LCDPAC02 TaxID=2506601 RepID=A0A481YPR5_9VIRU|nr:MAG: hypothetical protein LCDPAC02_02780 [Pithovirus LCDPAC02]